MNQKRPKKNDSWLAACIQDVCHIFNITKPKQSITPGNLEEILSKIDRVIEKTGENAPEYRKMAVYEEALKISSSAERIVAIWHNEENGDINDHVHQIHKTAETLKILIPNYAKSA